MYSRNIIFTREALAEAVDYLMTKDAFAFDVETMGEDRGVPVRNQVTWIALATEGRTFVIPMGHPNGNVLLRKATRKKNAVTKKFDPIPALYDDPPEQLRPSEVFAALEPLFFSDKVKIAHNAPFDVISIAKYYDGRTITGPIICTITLQWLLNENLKMKGLKELTERYWKVKYDHEGVGKCVEAHPFKKVAHYAYMDAKYTWLLYKKLSRMIERAGLSNVWNLEIGITRVECNMGKIGAPVDEERLHILERELSDMLIDVEGRIYREAGARFNINSAPQKSEKLFAPKSAGGQGLKATVLTAGGEKKRDAGTTLEWGDYSTSAETLEAFEGNPLVDAMAEYAEVDKLLGTYIQGYLGREEKGTKKAKPRRIYDGRIHAELVQYGTVTGRFSCREPNLQNIPRPDTDLGKRIRGLFIAPPGYKMVVADYAQIEMMLLAHFIGRGALFEGILNGMDPHSATAAALAGIEPDKFMEMVANEDPEAKKARQVAKGVNFAVVYGAGPEKVASMASVTLKEAKRFLRIHQEEFPEIYEFKDRVIEACRSRKPPHIRTMSGRKRRLPAIWSQNFGVRGQAERQAVNSLIQGSAADVIKTAMIRLDATLPEDMHLILSVHDELVTLAPEDRADECADLVREAMLGEGLQKMVKVPLASDVKIVDRWADAK